MNKLLSFILAFICLAAALPLQAQDTGIEQFTMPKKDGRQGDKTVNGQLRFYDMGGPTGATAQYYAGYTRFVPATEGRQIRVTFEKIDLQGAAAVYVYDGDIDFTDYYDSALPDGYLGKLTGNVGGQSFQSTSGSLSVLYYCKGSASGAGWEATVEEFIPKDMEWKSVAVAQAAGNAYRGQAQAPIMSANLVTDGSNTPFTCTELAFNLAGTTNLADISSVKVIYSKGQNAAEGVQFGEALTPTEGALTFTGSQELRGGNNYFWLVADVAPDADITHKLDASLSGAIVGGTQRIAAAMSAEGETGIDNIALLAGEQKTYTIGSQALTLYDDGGVEGNITQNFDGLATFRPSTQGKVVKVTFTALDLFNTSSTGLNDVLNIYGGTTADASALLANILKDVPPVSVTSTAADGALTISLKSVAGTPRGGFTATVEEIEPVAMAIQTAETTHPASGTACAGDEDVQMLQIRVNTAGTASPVQVETMTFSNPSQAPIAKAKLYSLGLTATGSQHLVGEVAAPGSEYTMTLSEPVTLSERDNYFLLCYDLDGKAINGQTVDAAVTRVNADYNVAQGNPEGNMTVLNLYASTSSNAVKTVYGEWQFTNRPSTSSYYGYDDTEGNQVTTFLPGNAGKTIELDFSQFKLYTSSYQPDPTFTVYDGKDTNAEVLWSAGKAEMTTGPGRILRATNADGALTVLFNANGGRGSSGYGFKAAVSEYSPAPMTAKSITASQMSADEIVRPGMKDLPILAISAVMEGDQNPLSLDALTLNLKDNYTAVSKVKLYTTGRGTEFAKDNLVAEAAVEASSVTLTPSPAFTMPEKDSNYWVTFDMADSFASDLVIDAAVAELKLGGNAVEVTTPDPEGNAVTKNLYYFQDGDNTITVNGSLLFYDNMGPDAKYTTEAKGSVTFKPAHEGEIIRMTVKNFYTHWKDHLYFYDGANPAEDAVAAQDLSSSKEAADIAPIISKADDGAITVKFNPTKSNTNNGWEILVESFVPKPMQFTKVEVTPVNDVKMLRGSMDNKLLKLALTVEGEKGKASLDKLQFSALETADGAVSAAKVYYTGAVDAFDTATLYGAAQAEAPYTFEGKAEFDAAGTYYYWLTYDIPTDIANESKVQAQFLSLTSGETTLAPAEEAKVLVTVQDGMHGVYSVGTNGDCDFRSITEAVNAMVGGIDGPVVFELEDGNYNELVTIPAVIGSSELNTVTLRSKSGNRDNVIISYDTYRDPGSSAYDKRYGVVTFDGIDYCTLENVTVTSTATTFPGLVFSRNKSDHITVRGCTVKLPTSTDAAKGTSLIYQYAKDEANSNNNYLTVEDCKLEGGLIGVSLKGTGHVDLPQQRGGVVRNNTFINQGEKAIYVSNEEDATVTGNSILCEGESTSSYNAIDVSDAGGNVDISGNVIRIKDNTGTRTPNPVGMYLRGYSIAKVKKGTRRVYNNEINMSGCPGSSATAIRINTEIPDLEIVNNTISIGATEGEDAPTGDRVYGIYMAGGIKGGRIVNNIIQCATPGNVIYVQRRNYLDGGTFSNNVCYVPGEDKFGYIGNTPSSSGSDPEGFTGGQFNFEDFCTWSGMTDSHFEQTTFLSANVLEPAAAGSLVAGKPLEYVATDLYGAERAATPTIGAYEYAESTVAPAMIEGYPAIKEIAHDKAVAAVKSTLTGTLHYVVMEASAQAPDAAAIKNEDRYIELRKGVEDEVSLDGLKPNTTYVMYNVLTSLRSLESEVIASAPFTTTYEPTRVATFEDAVAEGSRILDGTMSFTGFVLTDITDGVAPMPNTKAAAMDDYNAVVQLTNADNLSIEGMFVKSDDALTLTSKDAALKEVKTKTVAATGSWQYVDLLDMGLFTYLEFETEGNVAIDNFAAKPLEMLVSVDYDEATKARAGEQVSLPAVVDGGVPPYTYSWSNAMKQEAGTEATLQLKPEHSGTYSVTVIDARGAKASAEVMVRVLGDMAIATFDDLYLDTDSHWCGDVDDEDYMQGSFFSGSFEFNNLYMADWDSWAFFGYANHTATSFSSLTTDQWNSAVGHGVDESANYGVVYVSPYMGKTLSTLTNTDEGQAVPGMYVTNSAWVVDAILHGDGMSEAFGEGDLLTLKLTGKKADGSTSTMEIPLADYRAADAKDRWYLDTWQWVDLSPLGDVTEMEWDITSSKTNSYGITTPTYVCVDNIGAVCPVSEGETAILKVNEEEPVAEFELAPYFSFNPEDGTVAYSIDCDDERVALVDGGKVTCSAKADETLELTAHATQRGRHEWVRIPVSMTDKPLGIAAVELEGVALYPNPANAYVKVNADAANYDVYVIAMDGRTVMNHTGLTGTATLDVTSLADGSYIVKLIGNDGATAVRKLIVRH